MLKLCLFLCVIIVLITLCMITYYNFTPPKAIIIYEIQQKISKPEHVPAAHLRRLEPREIEVLYFKAKVTAYNSEICQTDDTPKLAAWNNPVYDGMIAVSRDLEKLGLKRGCKIYIDGHEFVIDDRMHKRKKNQFDIWMKNKEDAENWGVQEKDVIVLDPNVIKRVISNLGIGVLDMNLKFMG